MTRRIAWAVVFALAIGMAAAPLPDTIVERWYSNGLFPIIQRRLTPLSNLAPFALFDVLWIGAVAAVAILCRRRILASGWTRGALRILSAMLCAAALTYLAFLAMWGLNYRRVPLVDKVVFDPDRVTREASMALGDWAVSELNARYADAHAGPMSLDALQRAFDEVQRVLGGRPIVFGRPKQTLLGWYFHKAAIAGMTDPFLLETLVAPDLIDVERPFVIAHEWAHLAGYADESEANFVAYLTCRRGEPMARYSVALMMLGYAGSRRSMASALDIGPKTDLFTIQTRYARTSGVLRFAARESYDRYLKANRVEKGVESYDAVVQLILGTVVDSQGNPRLR
jgi:hypothetical protein